MTRLPRWLSIHGPFADLIGTGRRAGFYWNLFSPVDDKDFMRAAGRRSRYILVALTFALTFLRFGASDSNEEMAQRWGEEEDDDAGYWFGAQGTEYYMLDTTGQSAQTAMQSSSKIPPYWSPELELRGYPFRTWVQDVNLWMASTELNEQSIAGAVAQRLGGVARSLVR